jgi:hypothetical protein
MVSLLDLKRRSTDVDTSAGKVTMWAVSAEGIAHLVGKHPIVKKLVDGEFTEADFNVESLFNAAPDLVADLIAAGADHPGDPDYVKAAREAALGDQVALLAGVLEASMPKGPAPFLAAFSQIGASLGLANGMKALASHMPKQSKRS